MNHPGTEREFYSLLTNLWERQVDTLRGLAEKLLEHLQEEQGKRQEAEREVENLYARIQVFEVEKERDKECVLLDHFCPHCNRPWRYWNGKRYCCWQCGEF